MNNGGCDSNALCSFDITANTIKCTCKVGYSNTGTGSTVVCTGKASFFNESSSTKSFHICISDSCKVNNGGCGCRATCSHDSYTYAVKCTCKTGYTNTGSGSSFVCTGNSSQADKYFDSISSIITFRYWIVDSCLVNNGGCGINATCSHDDTTDAVRCTCKTGFINIGSSSAVMCRGSIFWFE